MALKPDGIGIMVSNMKASLEFYRLLGFPIAANQENLDSTNSEDGEDHVLIPIRKFPRRGKANA